jgi:hypothetical protein
MFTASCGTHEMNGRNSDESTYFAATWPLEQAREPPLAAHLVTPRRGYTHHGLYVGGGRVIHYSGFAGGVRRGTVEEVSLPCFARGHAVRVMPRDSQRFENGEVVRRARSRLGENCYRLLSNNCEHLCNWCLYGEAVSGQTERWLRAPAFARSMLYTFAACLFPLLGSNVVHAAADPGSISRPALVPAITNPGLPLLVFETSNSLRNFVDSHRQGLAIVTLWQNPRHRLAVGINTRGVPGLYLTMRK